VPCLGNAEFKHPGQLRFSTTNQLCLRPCRSGSCGTFSAAAALFSARGSQIGVSLALGPASYSSDPRSGNGIIPIHARRAQESSGWDKDLTAAKEMGGHCASQLSIPTRVSWSTDLFGPASKTCGRSARLHTPTATARRARNAALGKSAGSDPGPPAEVVILPINLSSPISSALTRLCPDARCISPRFPNLRFFSVKKTADSNGQSSPFPG